MTCSGSGIYSGRSGALATTVSQVPRTQVIVAKVPINLPTRKPINKLRPNIVFVDNEIPIDEHSKHENIGTEVLIQSNETDLKSVGKIFDNNLKQDDMSKFTVKFLNVTLHSNQSGSVCHKDVCCEYNVDIRDNGQQAEKVRFYFFLLQ